LIFVSGIATNGENGPTTIIDGYVGELGLLNPNDIETTVLKMHKQQFTVLLC
jgi:hypothetical protein